MAHFLQQAVYQGLSVTLPNGHRVTLDFVDESTKDGYLATENGFVVNQIRQAINSRSGGWMEITESEYLEAVKKKANPPASLKKRFRSLNAGMFQPNRDAEAAHFAAVVAKPDPIKPPTADEMKLPPRPRVGKLVPA